MKTLIVEVSYSNRVYGIKCVGVNKLQWYGISMKHFNGMNLVCAVGLATKSFCQKN